MTTSLLTRHQDVIPVRIPIAKGVLHGGLGVARNALGTVIFVLSNGSSRLTPRYLHVAEELNKRGLSTLLLDLLTEEEQKTDAETMQYRFDIPFLVSRSTPAACWVRQHPELTRLPVGLFGASTGAAAALITAAVMKHQIAAVVSHGGRPDLAEDALKMVEAPTLLIVGAEDKTVLALNQQAAARLLCVYALRVVQGATNLFEEPGALEQVIKLATEWFFTHMRIHMLNQQVAC